MKSLIGIAISILFFLSSANGQNDYQNRLAECFKLEYLESQQCMLGQQTFNFVGKTYEGDIVSSAELKGKVLVLNFWFMACPPCMAELGGLNAIVDQYQDANVEFISFTLDEKKDLARDFFPNHSFKFKVVPDCQDFIIEELKLGWGFPTTFIIDQEGTIQKIISGGETEEVAASAAIKAEIIPELEKLLR